MITRLLANIAVSDAVHAETWYDRLLDREADARPMPGLSEWHLSDTFGVQIWEYPDRAGYSTLVVDETDLDATAHRLTEAGINHGQPQPGGGARILQVADPDGNTVVFTGR